MTKPFSKTPKQIEAIKLLGSAARHIMLYGGSRSGKTFIACYAVIVRACREKSRHVILRQKFNHIKRSIWLDTMPKVISLCFPDLQVEWKGTDYYLKLSNGSEIWIGGLDDKQRTEKILGQEYSTIYFNECSQLSLDSISLALTRLAEKNDLTKKVYYDENPPSKKHWSYHLFIKHFHPKKEELVDSSKYVSIVMNPMDNLENIDEDYVKEVLEDLAEKDRDRFLHGKFTDSDDGAVYYAFTEDNVNEFIPERFGTTMIGMDFNVNPMTSIVAKYVNNTFYIEDERYLPNSDTPKMCNALKVGGYTGASIYPDSTCKGRKTSGKSDMVILKESGFNVIGTKNPYVRDRVNNINRLLEQGRIVIHPRCKKLIADLEGVFWKNNGTDLDDGPEKNLTHISDALGYLCWSIAPLVSLGRSRQRSI